MRHKEGKDEEVMDSAGIQAPSPTATPTRKHFTTATPCDLPSSQGDESTAMLFGADTTTTFERCFITRRLFSGAWNRSHAGGGKIRFPVFGLASL